MTGREIYTAALANLGQHMGDHDLWDGLAVQWLNQLLSEALPTENALRRYYCFAELTEMQTKTLDEELRCRKELRQPLIDGMTAILRMENDEEYKTQDYRARFAVGLRDAVKIRPERVVDVYG